MATRIVIRDKYQYICSTPNPVQRLMHYPTGMPYLIAQASLEAESCPGSLISILMMSQPIERGSCYLTVPLELPEGMHLEEDLWSVGFYSQADGLDPAALGELPEISMVDSVNQMFRDSLHVNDHWIVTQLGMAPPGYESPEPPLANNWSVQNVWYETATATSTDEQVWGVLNNVVPRFRFLVSPPPREIVTGETRLPFFANHTHALALQVFDYCGYLVWFPGRVDKTG